MFSVDDFINDFKEIYKTLEDEQTVFDYGLHLNRVPFMDEATMCFEVEHVNGPTLDKLRGLGYDITNIVPFNDDKDNKLKMRVYFKRII